MEDITQPDITDYLLPIGTQKILVLDPTNRRLAEISATPMGGISCMAKGIYTNTGESPIISSPERFSAILSSLLCVIRVGTLPSVWTATFLYKSVPSFQRLLNQDSCISLETMWPNGRHGFPLHREWTASFAFRRTGRGD